MQMDRCTTQNINSLNLVLTKPDRGDCFCTPPFTSYFHCPGDLLRRWGKPQEGIFILICRNAFCGVWICGNTVKGIGYCGPYLLDRSFLSVLRQCPTVPFGNYWGSMGRSPLSRALQSTSSYSSSAPASSADLTLSIEFNALWSSWSS